MADAQYVKGVNKVVTFGANLSTQELNSFSWCILCNNFKCAFCLKD